jgi:hypothetical protein
MVVWRIRLERLSAAGQTIRGGSATNPYAALRRSPAAPAGGSFDGPITEPAAESEDIRSTAGRYGRRIWDCLPGHVGRRGHILRRCGPFGILKGEMEDHGDPGGAAVLSLTGNIISNLVQLYFGIGLAQISLSLARGGRAEFVDLFRGGSRFMPVLGISILTGLAVSFGLLACIVPGIILALMFWPTYYLVLEEKAGIIESFSVARHVTEGNFATAIALWLLSVGVTILGFLMLCIGILFAAPLVSLFWATAYLMMSGQLAPGAERPATGYGV